MARPPLVLLQFLVAMVAAAPLAEKANNKEQAVGVGSNEAVVDRAKRAKEVVSFGNQQNSERLGVAKKSFQDEPVDVPVGSLNPAQPVPLDDGVDKSGGVYASEERLVVPESKLEEAEVKDETLGEDNPANSAPAVPTPAAAADDSMSAAHEDARQVSGEGSALPEPSGPEQELPVLTQLPENSQTADAEEVLLGQAQQQQMLQAENKETDDVEEMLKELSVEDEPVEVDDKSAAARTGEILQAENEKTADAQLLPVAGTADVKDLPSEDEEYTNNLLKYILMNGGRMTSPYIYYLQRRRRSSNLRRWRPGLRYHRNGEAKQLARAKRTKRDLFDDDLYYNPDKDYRVPAPYEYPREVADRESELEELLPYLLALYPNLLDDLPGLVREYPGYAWEGQNYPEAKNFPPAPPVPEASFPEWEDEEEEEEQAVPGYDLPPPGWEPEPEPASAVLQPAFYPEVEREDYYPPPAKRQMMSWVPGSRRKRYFWPVALEPYSHWGAFVPSQEKRSYDDPYRRLRELSAVLGDGRSQSSAYIEALEDYKK